MVKKKIIIIMASIISQYSCNISCKDVQALFNELYASVNGYELSSGESDEMARCDAASTYGEILYNSLKTILDDLNLTKDDVFYDLGSGIGKVAIQTSLTTPAKKVVGIELAKTRHDKAVEVKNKLEKQGKLDKNRRLELLNKNIIDVPLDDATVIFMCSTCFSDQLMKKITDNLLKNNHTLRIITLKQLPSNPRFKLEKTYTLPMTWSNGTQVHLYSMQ